MGPWAGLVSGSSKETGSDYSLALEKTTMFCKNLVKNTR